MDKLIATSNRMINEVHPIYQRLVLQNIHQEAQLNIFLGLRGVGKTTYLLQKAQSLQKQNKSVLYISLDDFYFLDHSPMDAIDQFHAEGGEYLFIDEVHYYEHWSRLLKRTFDLYPRLRVWATGSSALKVYQGKADLARRGHFYIMPGLSFREYAAYHYRKPPFEKVHSLEELIANRMDIAGTLGRYQGIRKVFHDYLKQGYFPFTLQTEGDHLLRIRQTIQSIFQTDMKLIDGFDLRDTRQTLAFMKQIAASAPYQFNATSISKKIGINRNKLLRYIYKLEEADLVYLLSNPSSKKGSLTKPEKIYLSNPNMYYALDPDAFNTGSVREAFAMNQLTMTNHEVSLHPTADFLVNGQYVLEIGGESKNLKQISGLENGYIFADNLEIAYSKRLPLWMLGLLY